MSAEAQTVAVLRRTLEIIQERGWAASLSTDPTSPLNLRNAIGHACTDVIGIGTEKWYSTYLAAVRELGSYLQSGISHWEFSVKAPSEVEQMLTEVIARMEQDAI